MLFFQATRLVPSSRSPPSEDAAIKLERLTIFQHSTCDVHCCSAISCASPDKGYARLLVPYSDQSAPPGRSGPSHEVEEVVG
jgi:hypothetical protein